MATLKTELKLKADAQEKLITKIIWDLKLYGRESDRFDALMGVVATLFENPAEFWNELAEVEEVKEILNKAKK